MITNILIVFAVLVIGLVIVVSTKPKTFRVERSVSIAAPAAEIFPHVNDLRKVQVWSPWVKLDPSAQYTFEGPAAGVGASQTWVGNGKAGAGRQTIVESRPGELVRIRLDFKKPFESTCTADYALKSQGGQTVVTWSIYGQNNFVSRLFCVFMNQDKMIGGEFEKGLADLKRVVESAGKPVAAG